VLFHHRQEYWLWQPQIGFIIRTQNREWCLDEIGHLAQQGCVVIQSPAYAGCQCLGLLGDGRLAGGDAQQNAFALHSLCIVGNPPQLVRLRSSRAYAPRCPTTAHAGILEGYHPVIEQGNEPADRP